MKLPKKIHVALILLLLVGLIYFTMQIEWSKILNETFEWKSLQGFLVTLLVLLVLIFQYKFTHTKQKPNDGN